MFGFSCDLVTELLASHHTCVVNIDCHGAVLVSAEYQQCLFHNPAEVDTIVLFPRILHSAQLCLLKIVTLSHCCNCLNKMIP